MPNNIAKETPLENAGLWHFTVIKDDTDPDTGDLVHEVPVTGRNDLSIFISGTKSLKDSVPLHEDLVLPLICINGTNRYKVVPPGALLRDRVPPEKIGDKLYVHAVDADRNWHEVAETTFVDERMAVNG